jgi:hypothetical protein
MAIVGRETSSTELKKAAFITRVIVVPSASPFGATDLRSG